jgi:hypothetical protein
MNTFNLKETTVLLHSYGFKCAKYMVRPWKNRVILFNPLYAGDHQHPSKLGFGQAT